MTRHPLQLLGHEIRLPVVVVDAVDHGVLKGDPPSRLLEIPAAGAKQLLHVAGPVHRHDLGAGLAVRRVEGDRQRQLQSQLRQPVNAGHHAAGGQGDVPHPDVQAVGMVHQLQKAQHVVQIVQRLADAHQARCWRWAAPRPSGRRSPGPASPPASGPAPCRQWWRRRRRSPSGSPPERRCRRCCRGDTASKPSRCSCRPPVPRGT